MNEKTTYADRILDIFLMHSIRVGSAGKIFGEQHSDRRAYDKVLAIWEGKFIAYGN